MTFSSHQMLCRCTWAIEAHLKHHGSTITTFEECIARQGASSLDHDAFGATNESAFWHGLVLSLFLETDDGKPKR